VKTVFGKSLLVLTLAALGISLFFIVSALFLMDSLYYETNARNLRDTARLLRSVMGDDFFLPGNYGPEGAGAALLRRTADTPYRLTLIGEDGAVLADSQFDPAALENHRDRPEVAAALAGRIESSRRKSVTAGTDLFYAALPVYAPKGGGAEGGGAGVLRLSLPIPSFRNRIASAVSPYFHLPVLIMLIAAGGVYLFSRSLGKSFKDLVGLTRTVSAEDHHEQGTLISDTREFTILEGALRSMAEELKIRISRAREESRRLAAILNGMSEAVFAMDDRLTLSLVNPRARSLFQIPGEREPGSLSLLEATHSAELEAAAGRVLAEKSSLEFEMKIHAAGNRRCFRVFAGPLPEGEKSGAGETKGGVIMVLGDITRLVKLEEVRRDFVANVSHELRTPIQLVKGYAETLLDSSLGDEEQLRRGIGIILKSAVSMENLTNDLLSLAALEDEAGLRQKKEIRRIRELLEEAAAALFPAEKTSARITVDCPEDLSAGVYGSLLVQAVINLLDNAVKYSPPASRITVRAEIRGEELCIEVQDEGPGIPAGHLERIFERFYRIDKARSRDASAGTGLGLAIVRHIALLHQGTAEAESHPGEGSLFRIRIPAA
jgi:two-component system phosphate regulon sensor histidine kinase PhoR